MPHWLFIEPGLNGHHATYLEHIVAAAIDKRLRVTVVLADNDESRLLGARWHNSSPEMELIHKALTESCKRQGQGFMGLMFKELAYWSYCRATYMALTESRSFDRVFLPYIDYCLYACGLRGSPFGNTTFEGICMRPAFHYREMGVIAPRRISDVVKKPLFIRALKIPTLSRIFTNDETLFLYGQRRPGPEWRKLQHFPDPVEFLGTHTRQSAREALGITQGACVILVYGFLGLEKGLKYLLRGIDYAGAPERPILLVAGECTRETRKLLEGGIARKLKQQGRLVVLDCRVTDEEEQMCFAAADISWVGYRDKYCMSGVLVKAIQAGHWVIAASCGVVHWYASKLPRMVSVTVDRPEEISRAIRHCQDRLGEPRAEEKSRIFSRNTWQQCEQIIFE